MHEIGTFRANPLAKKYVLDALSSGRLSYGKYHRLFEKQFAKLHGCEHGVFCNSGTSALQIALQALKEHHGWADGDEVLVPSVTFVATSNIVIHNRMKPVFVDVDKRTYNIDPKEIKKHITKRTRAVIPVHLMGLPCDMGPIVRLARSEGLKIIEDACETILARYRGRPVGSFGDISCFSTYMAHYVVTGAGGLALTNDPVLAIRLRSLMNHGRDSIYLNIDDDANNNSQVIARRFNFVSLGHSYRSTELEAAVGLSQLPTLRKTVAQRVSRAKRLTRNLSGLEKFIQLPFVPKDREHAFMLYPIVVRKGGKRLLIRFLEDNGIETRDLLPLISQPIYKKLFGGIEDKYPVAKWLNACGLYVGCHQHMSMREIDFISDKIREFFSYPPPKA